MLTSLSNCLAAGDGGSSWLDPNVADWLARFWDVCAAANEVRELLVSRWRRNAGLSDFFFCVCDLNAALAAAWAELISCDL